jgi:hypothetical protein
MLACHSGLSAFARLYCKTRLEADIAAPGATSACRASLAAYLESRSNVLWSRFPP